MAFLNQSYGALDEAARLEQNLLESADENNDIVLNILREQLEISEDEILNERNIVKYDKQTKFKRLKGRAAIIVAKEKGDRLYKLLVIFRRKYMEIKRAIGAKYGSQALTRAKIAAKTGKLIDPKKVAEIERVARKGNEPKSKNKF